MDSYALRAKDEALSDVLITSELIKMYGLFVAWRGGPFLIFETFIAGLSL